MTFILISVVLVAIIAWGSYLFFRLQKLAKCSYTQMSNPDALDYILKRMIYTVEKDGDWNRLEVMRGDVRRALRDLDRLRHDTSNYSLRQSKRSHETFKESAT